MRSSKKKPEVDEIDPVSREGWNFMLKHYLSDWIRPRKKRARATRKIPGKK